MDEAGIGAALGEWRAAHPRATWDEIEDEVQRQVAGLQATWMAQLAGAPPAEEPPPRCPTCAGALRRAGRRTRQLVTRMGRTVPLERPYYVCPACGAGVFPPG